MRSSIFLSYPKPWSAEQEAFIEGVTHYLKSRGFEPRTLGVTDYDMDAPLNGVRRLMLEANGLVTIAFRRLHVASGAIRRRPATRARASEAPPPLEDETFDDRWLSTPWPHIEAAMAFQLGLPILVFREAGVVADGVLEPGVVGLYLPEVDLTQNLESYLQSPEWTEPLGQWEGRVRRVIEHKGTPPRLY